MVSLNFVYADSGPTIGENQAKITADDYLSSHNLSYTAATPGYDNWRIKVKDTKTGKIQWIAIETYYSQFPSKGSGPTGNERYVEIYGVPTVWIVQVNDNWKNVGKIYINDGTGEILKVVINGKVLENTMPQGNQTILNDTISQENQIDEDSSTSIDTANQIPQDTPYIGLTLVVASILIIVGVVGYWFKIRK